MFSWPRANDLIFIFNACNSKKNNLNISIYGKLLFLFFPFKPSEPFYWPQHCEHNSILEFDTPIMDYYVIRAPISTTQALYTYTCAMQMFNPN